MVLVAGIGLLLALNSAMAAPGSTERPARDLRANANSMASCALTALTQSRLPQSQSSSSTVANEKADNPERLLALIATELKLQHVDRARQWVVKATKLFPQDPALAFQIGRALLEHNLPDDAEVEFDRAAGLLAADTSAASNFNASDLYLQMARLHYDRHDYWGALGDLRKVRIDDVSPQLRPSAWHLAGQSLVGVGNAHEALENLQQAIQLNPANPEYPVHLAWAQLLAGDTKAADATAQSAWSKWPNVPDVQLMQTLVKRESAVARESVPLSQEWRVNGEGLVCCPCKTPCPCRSNGMPTHTHCENTGLVRIRQGHYGNVSLDGFSFVAVNDAMEAQGAPAMLYVEPSASDQQLIALERIMQSFNPLQPSLITAVERVPISFISNGPNGVYEVKIPKVLEIRIRRRLDADGKPLFATAALDQFSNTIEYAQNLTYKLWNPDGTLKWDYSGRQANWRSIDLQSDAYVRQTMLIQFADAAGAFNKKQWELIKSQNLPLPHMSPQNRSLQNQPAERQPKR
jgi:Flp pilus assembly protein TadD